MASAAFLETPRFSESISYNSKGGPRYRTVVVELRSGYESRNVGWVYPRHEYDAVYGIRSQDDLEEILEFFHAVRGRAYGFRWKDWADYKSCNTGDVITCTDQTIGTGDGSTTDFQLVKNYTKGSLTLERKITKPVEDTVVVAVDSVQQETGWTVDTTTGIITFDSSHIPAEGTTITAGYEFDVPVRFDTDSLSVVLEDYQLASTSVPIVEVRA